MQREQNQYDDLLETTQRGSMDVTPWLGWFLACLLRAVQGADGMLAGVGQGPVLATLGRQATECAADLGAEHMLDRTQDGMESKLMNTGWAALGKCS